MYVEKIVLENFRNYEEKTLNFDKKGSFLCGKNGSGKTNLLESLYVLSYGKSFRTANLEELVMFSKDFFGITGVFNDSIKKEIKFRFSKNRKKILVNDVEVSGIKELIGTLAIIFFCLGDINLVTGEPALRRRFIDSLLSLLSHEYLVDLLDYRRVLRQRNKILYLKKIGKRDDLSGITGWTEELIIIGTRIIEKRLSIMEELNKRVAFYYTLFSPNKDKLSIEYLPSFQSKENIGENFRNSINKKQDEEIGKGMTIVGPHRDELLIKINDKSIRKFASEGEQRTCAISLKIAQSAFLKSKMGNEPILLVDEALAELDMVRKEKVLNSLTQIGQSIIATTDCKTMNNMTTLEMVNID